MRKQIISQVSNLKIFIYWLPFTARVVLKPTKLFHRSIPEAGPGWIVIIESFDSLATPLRGKWRKGNFVRRIVRGIFKKSFHPLCATLPRRRGRRSARWILQFSQGRRGEREWKRVSGPSLAPPSAPRGKEIRANKKATLRILIPPAYRVNMAAIVFLNFE